MKILIDQNDNTILTEIAQHLGVELDAPMLLYEIDSQELAVCAIALGGIQWVETSKQPAPATLAIVEPEAEPEDIGQDLDPVSQLQIKVSGNGHKTLTLGEDGQICEICRKPFHGHALAKVCSPECRKEKQRRYVAEHGNKDRKLRKPWNASKVAPLDIIGPHESIGRNLDDLDDLEEAGTETAFPLA